SGKLRERPVERLEQRLHFLAQPVTGGGEIERARAPLEQPHAEEGLELLHLVAHRGRREAKLGRCALEAALPRGHAERAQIAKRRRSGQSHHGRPPSLTKQVPCPMKRGAVATPEGPHGGGGVSCRCRPSHSCN